jgi:hypothetical protein
MGVGKFVTGPTVGPSVCGPAEGPGRVIRQRFMATRERTIAVIETVS